MNRKAAISVVIALTMTAGQLAFAQGNSNRNERGGNEGRQPERGGNEGRQPERGGNEGRQPERGVAAASHYDNRGFGRAHNEERSKGRGAGPNSEYYRGDRLPAEYRHRQYVVNDWRGHNLSAPPRGYQWVQSGADYILIAVATGVIAQLLLSR